MVDAVRSGYKAAAQAVVFSGTRTLVSLADNEWTDIGDEVDNSVTKYMMMDLQLTLGSAVFTGTDSILEIYVIPTVDDTLYPTWTGDGIVDEQENQIHFVGSVTTDGTTAAQEMALRDVSMPNGKFKFGVRNRSGVALAASGNTLFWRPWNFSSQ